MEILKWITPLSSPIKLLDIKLIGKRLMCLLRLANPLKVFCGQTTTYSMSLSTRMGRTRRMGIDFHFPEQSQECDSCIIPQVSPSYIKRVKERGSFDMYFIFWIFAFSDNKSKWKGFEIWLLYSFVDNERIHKIYFYIFVVKNR